MKRNRTLLMLLMALLSLPAIALDFSYEHEGQTLKYTVLDEEAKTCMVATNTYISGDLIIPSQADGYLVTEIGEGAFAYGYALSSIKIPNSVTSIGDLAFSFCRDLISIKIPNSVNSIGMAAFSDCTSLTSIEIPNSVTKIGEFAFSYCSSLTSVDIPASVSEIGDGAFDNCTGLTSINVSSSNKNYSSMEGVLFNLDQTTLIRCPGGKETYTIPSSVVTIGEKAFSACARLTSVEIPNSVITIEQMAFYRCGSLTSVNIPNSVTSIGEVAFEGCSSLASIEIPNSITTIEYESFYGCSSLTSVEIPGSVTTIRERAFGGCSNLLSINVDSSNQNYASEDGILFNHDKTILIQCPGGKTTCNIPNSVTTIGFEAFAACEGLTSIELPNSVTSIVPRAFVNCTGLTWMDIPDSVTRIGGNAFSYCSGLTSVKIPGAVTEIESSAFAYCTSLASVYYNTENPITGDSSIFWICPEDATLYVPEAAVEKCRQIDPWKQFKNIEAYNFTSGVEAIGADFNKALPVEVYNLNGVKIADTLDGLATGLYIVRQGNAVKKIAVK